MRPVPVDLEGNIIDPGDQELPRVQAAAFAIHGAVHMAHMDSGAAQCVMHTHEKHVAALSSLRCGLLPMSQTALLTGDVAYHKFGPPLTESECDDMVASMGDRYIMLLENHGVVACGKTVAHAFAKLFYIHKAAEIQILAMQCVPGPSPPPSP